MTEDKSTPRPWSVVPIPHYRQDGPSIELTDNSSKLWALRHQWQDDKGRRCTIFPADAYSEANAELIVRAVNSFDGLVEALDKCRAIIKFHVKNAGACCSFSPESEPFSALDASNLAVNALASARGETK